MSKVNYKLVFEKRAEAEKRVREICRDAAVHRSGIYFYTRKDDEGTHAYIGKAVDLLNRTISHLNGYQQRIDISLKSRGFYSTLNPTGWNLNVLYYPKAELNKWERHWIEHYQSLGIHLYNVESGGTDGKTIIGERKPPRTYRDGLIQGRRSLAKELKHIIEKHLDVRAKSENKITEKALKKFWKLLGEE